MQRLRLILCVDPFLRHPLQVLHVEVLVEKKQIRGPSPEAEGYVVLLPYGGEDTLVQGLVGREGELVSFTVVVRSPECREVALRLGRSLVPLP